MDQGNDKVLWIRECRLTESPFGTCRDLLHFFPERAYEALCACPLDTISKILDTPQRHISPYIESVPHEKAHSTRFTLKPLREKCGIS